MANTSVSEGQRNERSKGMLGRVGPRGVGVLIAALLVVPGFRSWWADDEVVLGA